jgi:uncharacterized integral membrane protein
MAFNGPAHFANWTVVVALILILISTLEIMMSADAEFNYLLGTPGKLIVIWLVAFVTYLIFSRED